MPLDGGGTASKPAGTTATSGATISSASFNSVIDDIYSIFNTARPVAYGGTGGGTAVAGYDGLDVAGADIATGSTINLDNATGPFVKLTGTTTVSAVTLASGKGRMAYAAGAFQLTASANLIVNGSTSVNYTTTAGDLLIFRGMGSSVVRVWAISPTAWAAITGKPTTLSGYGITDTIIKSVKTQVFTSSGTYTPSTGMVYADIICVGGGGGGGGAAASGGAKFGQGGGGGGGAVSRLLATVAIIGSSQTVTVGAAGSGGTAGNNAGGAGGDTSVGTLCVAKGGGAGGGAAAGSGGGTGGAGGAGASGTGDIKLSGGAGGYGAGSDITYVHAAGGEGGGNMLSPATLPGDANSTGRAGGSYGAGGVGGTSLNSSSSFAGGAGAAGIVIITEYCTQ